MSEKKQNSQKSTVCNNRFSNFLASIKFMSISQVPSLHWIHQFVLSLIQYNLLNSPEPTVQKWSVVKHIKKKIYQFWAREERHFMMHANQVSKSIS